MNDKALYCRRIVTLIVGLFCQRKLSTQILLTGTGIFIKDIQRLDFTVSPHQLKRLFDNANRQWEGNDLTFLLGQMLYTDLADTHANLLNRSNDLNVKYSNFYRFLQLSQPWIQLINFNINAKKHLLISPDFGFETNNRFILEVFSSSLSFLFKNIDMRFSFPFSKPSNTSQYLKYLNSNITFDAPIMCVSASGYERIELRQYDFDYRLAKSSAIQKVQVSSKQIGLPRKVKSHLLKESFKLPQLASNLDMSVATLKRRLKEFDTCFGQIQDEANLIKSLILLAEHDPSKTAKQLNEQDISNFRRAFKRWTGSLPSRYYLWLS
ncbi:helix-turn-helix transcriptional regulator [Shewanella sp. 202IG2-18]|uniref:AraC family transcriptional regulator n=1 Tax=Parashewanella hymeniacidonis TaxID=2807618 RepID=UPI00195FF155|nr:AraC family transcriptional regulator [Parashewanella hymeniacidonis]MBM7072725.1 helix-turn-helix transcriptional regulator [Parashewanella hymeniacidonis]